MNYIIILTPIPNYKKTMPIPCIPKKIPSPIPKMLIKLKYRFGWRLLFIIYYMQDTILTKIVAKHHFWKGQKGKGKWLIITNASSPFPGLPSSGVLNGWIDAARGSTSFTTQVCFTTMKHTQGSIQLFYTIMTFTDYNQLTGIIPNMINDSFTYTKKGNLLYNFSHISSGKRLKVKRITSYITVTMIKIFSVPLYFLVIDLEFVIVDMYIK